MTHKSYIYFDYPLRESEAILYWHASFDSYRGPSTTIRDLVSSTASLVYTFDDDLSLIPQLISSVFFDDELRLIPRLISNIFYGELRSMIWWRFEMKLRWWFQIKLQRLVNINPSTASWYQASTLKFNGGLFHGDFDGGCGIQRWWRP